MKFAVVILAAVALCHVQAYSTIVSPALLKTLASKGAADIMVIMKQPVSPVVDSINAKKFPNSGAKTTAMVAELRKLTQASQQEVLAFLNEQKSVGVVPLWITNRISVRQASANLVNEVASKFRGQVVEIREAVKIQLEDTKPRAAPSGPQPKVTEWGVSTIEADLAWLQGIRGEGVVVSSIDTGVRATHVALASNMRETYNWFDSSSAAEQTPGDKAGHGTHTMGTIAGQDGTGVAPGSQWIHCQAFEGQSASEEDLLECAQWITCPTLPDGRDEDCTKKPDVCSNSWGGGNEDEFFNDAINTWQAANIVPVFAIGNSGPLCRTANSPGDQPNLISVGATNAQNLIASFSSHGPSRTHLRIKPECSAPGNNVRSASNLGDRLYAYMSGTSMACPHTAGAVALLKSKKPDITFQEIQDAIYPNTHRVEMGEIVCNGGGVNETYPWPNNSHGWGNVRVLRALNSLS